MALARTFRGAVLVAVGALASAGCSSSQVPTARSTPTAAPSHAFPLTLSDDEGVRVTVPSAPRRIVTFAPADTEIVFALGLGSRLVGVSYHQFDDYPPAATAIPEVGGPNTAPSIEKVVALHPDLLLVTAGGQDWKGHLRQLGIPVFTTNATSFDDALHDIRTLGEVTGAEPAADRLAASMASQAAAIAQRVSAESGVSCFLDLGGLYTVGPNDFPFDLLGRAGCDPVTASATTSYPQWQKDELVKEDPAVYLFTSDSGDTVHGIESDAQLASIAAVTKGQVYSIDSDLISRPGPRLVQGITALARALHPDAFG